MKKSKLNEILGVLVTSGYSDLAKVMSSELDFSIPVKTITKLSKVLEDIEADVLFKSKNKVVFKYKGGKYSANVEYSGNQAKIDIELDEKYLNDDSNEIEQKLSLNIPEIVFAASRTRRVQTKNGVPIRAGMDLKKKKEMYYYAKEIWYNIKDKIDKKDAYQAIFTIISAMDKSSANHNKYKKFFPKKYNEKTIFDDDNNVRFGGMGDNEFKTMVKKVTSK